MQRFLRYLVVILLLASQYAYADIRTDLVLNGAYQNAHLGTPLYIGGLYLTERSADLDFIFSDRHPKQMRIVIQRDDWRPIGWTRHWRDVISVNGEQAVRGANFRAVEMFTELALNSLELGDEIVITYQDAKTHVYLNGERIIESNSVMLFNAILNTWIGRAPPSTTFRNAILGDSPPEEALVFAEQLDNHRYPSARRGVHAQWRRANQQRAEEARQQQEREEQELARLRAQELQVALSAQSVAVNTQTVESQPRPSAEEIRQAEATARAAMLAARKQGEELFLTELTQWQIQRYVNKHVQYPAWAQQLGQEGAITVPFKLVGPDSVAFLDNENSALSQEVKNKVRESLNHIDISEHVINSGHAFSVGYTFSLRGGAPQEPAQPTVPDHLTENRAPSDFHKVVLHQHTKALSERVHQAIQYPESARVQRQRGVVAATLTVDRWGEVVALSITKPNRHKLLNDAIESAVQASAPFKPFPLQVFYAEPVEITIEHNFR